MATVGERIKEVREAKGWTQERLASEADISKSFLSELLFAIANEVGTVFKEIHFEHDLQSLRDEYVQKGELIFANLENELGRPDDYGITIGIHPKNAWEPRFVSVIDCRGDKSYRTYFTKWHELAHLLTLTPQMRLLFRRSHSRENSADPEEKLMDIIASAVGFLPDFLPDNAKGELSFEAINEIKKEFCPGSSAQAATIGIVKAYPAPCILLEADMALKKDESLSAAQFGFGFHNAPSPTLRAIHATVNIAAREAGVEFFRNWRVPSTSIIADVYTAGGYAEADEDLAWWSASGGKHLDALPVRVKARKTGSSVQALVIPIRQD
jgi:transcriptional regulator with XRE-family HTH domain